MTNKIWKEYEDKIYEVEMNRPIAGMRINWLSGIFNWNRVIYRTYYDSLSFSDALTKVKTPGLTIGLQANFYTFYKPVHRASLFNIALLFKKTNNLDELPTSKLTDEVTEINGTTVRKSSTEYTVFTDPVDTFNTFQLPVNYYRFFGKDLSFGWHVFALADWRNNGKDLTILALVLFLVLMPPVLNAFLILRFIMKYKDIKREIVDEDETGGNNCSSDCLLLFLL